MYMASLVVTKLLRTKKSCLEEGIKSNIEPVILTPDLMFITYTCKIIIEFNGFS